MAGESNLHILLGAMKPEMQVCEYVFCSATESDFQQVYGAALGVFREQEGLSIILGREEADRLQLEYTYVARMITLAVHSSLDAVGFLAMITARLAAHSISVNVVSAYYHDHLFVQADRADDALGILEDIALQASGTDV
ncbi:MAG: ACT domain-containing protein [Desulfobulbaceae bacterium]|nr:ACT domain-containing protein [Desulfobulbaceae bacterium]